LLFIKTSFGVLSFAAAAKDADQANSFERNAAEDQHLSSAQQGNLNETLEQYSVE